MVSAACLDVLYVTQGMSRERVEKGKQLLLRIVAMLSRMTESADMYAREGPGLYVAGDAIGREYDDEQEHD